MKNKLTRNLFAILILIIACESDSNGWSTDKQTEFLNSCQELKGVSSNYCDCVLDNLMLEYTEESFKIESTEMLKSNISEQLTASISSISEECTVKKKTQGIDSSNDNTNN